MRRRDFLNGSLLVCAGLAGCIGKTGQEAGLTAPAVGIRMRPVTDLEIAEHVHGAVRNDGSGDARILATATTDGSATAEDTRPPLRDDDRIVYNGTLYRLSVSIEEQHPATVYPIELNDLAYDGVTTAADAESIRFADLPAVDKEIFRENSLADGTNLGIGTNLVYTDTEAERSVLVPTAEYSVIVWSPDRRGKFGLRGEPHDRTLSKYRYTAESVADSASAYGRQLREQYAINLTDVPDDEADILRTAAEGKDAYEVPPETTPSPAFWSLADRFRSGRDILTLRDADPDRVTSDPRPGTYLVRFDDQIYWTVLFVSKELLQRSTNQTSSS